jgi:hypothetical protein
MARGGNRYRAARAAGLCPRCFLPNPGPGSRCPACTEVYNANKRARDQRRKDAGRCIDCRADLTLFVRDQRWPHVRCFECHEVNRASTDRYNTTRGGRAKHRARMAALYRERRAAGQCVRCKTPAPDRLCETCTPKVKAVQIAYLDRLEAARAAA